MSHRSCILESLSILAPPVDRRFLRLKLLLFRNTEETDRLSLLFLEGDCHAIATFFAAFFLSSRLAYDQ